MTARSLIACGKHAPEQRRASRDRFPRRVLAARSCTRGGTGRDARRCKRPESAEDWPSKASLGAGLAADRWRGVADCGGSYRSGDAGRAGETVPKASCRPCRPLFCPPPRERSGRQTALAGVCKLQMALDSRRDDANVAHEKPPCWTNVGRLYPSRADN